MGKVDIDLEGVIECCDNFESKYVEPATSVVDDLVRTAGNILSELRNTQFATKRAEEVEAMAHNLSRILDEGDIRIRELKKSAQDALDRGREFTR